MPNLYKHYKGGIYELMQIARSSDKGNPQDLVVYRNVKTGQSFVRPAMEFFAVLPAITIPDMTDVVNALIRRFTPINDEDAK